MALWNNLSYKQKYIVREFGAGINGYGDPVSLKPNELVDSANMCCEEYPSIVTRPDRVISTLPETTTPIYGIGARNSSELHVLAGTILVYSTAPSTGVGWNTVSSSMAGSADATFVEFITQVGRYTICAHSTGVVYNSIWDGATYSTYTDTNSPRSNLYTSHKYRVYGVANDGRTLRYTKQASPIDWTTADDAGYVDLTNINGKPTAITTYSNHVIVWSQHTMHELYGTNQDNYELIDISNEVGCVSNRAFVECSGILFWLDYGGIYMYTGGIPRLIGIKAKKYIDGINWDVKNLICSGAKNSKIFFNIPYGSTANNRVIVMDIKDTSKIMIYTELADFYNYQVISENLFALGTTTRRIFEIETTRRTGYDDSTAATTIIPWYLETKPLCGEEMNTESAIRDIFIEHSGSTLGKMTLSYSTNTHSTSFTSLSTSFQTTGVGIYRHCVRPSLSQLQSLQYCRFKISGEGRKTINGMQANTISYGNVV